jgi:corrinoid protein of di/trimethylamine methyltransferase
MIRRINMDLNELSLAVQKGSAKKAKELVSEALSENVNPADILNDGLLSGMSIIGVKFKNNEVYVPEVLIAARAMNAGMQILEPILVETGVKPVGKAVIGTVKGDLHDIGKNLVRMMLKGAGIDVVDLGVDVSAETFVNKAEEEGAQIICVSALLTTTMVNMKSIIEELEKRGLRDKYIVMIGGAPVTENFAKQIGADYYTADAATAGEVAKKALS